MKATKSKDGVDRYTINVKFRIEPEKYRELSKKSRELGYDDLRDYLYIWVMDGLNTISEEHAFYTQETIPQNEMYGL